ncbi:MAG: F0F1 ATP synthase subunit delta [Clostridia bacterium]|nr:F0F1 ATP synthase subunit delta [Clostridia bacterium]
MTVTITVPKDLSDDIYEKILDGFKKKYGDDTVFIKEKSTKIIGGFIAEVDGTVYDTSIRSKLNEIKKAITS